MGEITTQQRIADLCETVSLNEREILRLVRACDAYESDARREREARRVVDAALAQAIAQRNRYQHEFSCAQQELGHLRDLLNRRDAEVDTLRDAEQRDGEHIASMRQVNTRLIQERDAARSWLGRVRDFLVGVPVDPDAPYGNQDEHGPISDDDMPF